MIAVTLGEGTDLDPKEVHLWCRVITAQIARHVAPEWQRIPVSVLLLDEESVPPEAHWIKVLARWESVAGGVYGRESDERVPDDVVVLDVLDGEWPVSAEVSRLAIGAFIDPQGSYWVEVDGVLWALEVADPVAGSTYTASFHHRLVPVADFLLPGWFSPEHGTMFDFSGDCSGALRVAKGGWTYSIDKGVKDSTSWRHLPDWRRTLLLDGSHFRSSSRMGHATTG